MREQALVMPKMSMTMEEGQVLTWHKAEGDAVRSGDVVCEVMTDKVNMDVEATVDGTITRIVAQQGDSLAVGDPMAYIATESDDLFEGLAVGPQQSAVQQPAAAPTAVSGDGTTSADDTTGEAGLPPSRKGPKPAAPLARRRAAELGIDLEAIMGTGAGGAITRKDVDEAAKRLAAAGGSGRPTDMAPESVPHFAPSTAAAPVPAPAPSSQTISDAAPNPAFADALTTQRRAIRAAVARKMTESAAVPQFTAYTDLDLEALAAERGRIGWTPLLIYAVARTLRDHPMLNSIWRSGEPVPAGFVGIALAVDTPVGLVAPVLVDPDRVGLEELTAASRRVVEHARSGRLPADALQGGTFTISNLGAFGVRAFQALVTVPQVAALSVGAIRQTPVAVGGALTVRTSCSVGLTVDHRAADGADAGRFLADLSELVASPSRLLAGRPRR